MYSRGGVFSITSRILIVDLLSSKTKLCIFQEALLIIYTDLLVPDTITGVVVLHADRYVSGPSEWKDILLSLVQSHRHISRSFHPSNLPPA